MKIQESAEDYLETILMLKTRTGAVRSIDIANEMHFSKPSVSIAIKRLRENGYVTVDGSGYIDLTDAGMEIAQRVYERHLLFTKLLMALGVNEETARLDACRIEHDLSAETFACIKEYCKKIGIV